MEQDKKFKSELSKQVMFDVMGTADYFIGEGTHKFDDFAVKMVHEFGHWIKPYLKLIYTGFRNFPINNGYIVEDMDSVEYVQSFDLMSLFTIEAFPDDYFKLETVDYQAIQLAQTAVRKLLERFELKSREVVGIGNYLYALERLPLRTFGVDVSITVVEKIDSESRHFNRRISFRIDEGEFGIQLEDFEDENSDEESFFWYLWIVDSNGERDTNYELAFFEDRLNKLLKEDIEIWVHDSSEIDFGEIDFVEYHTSDDN